MKYITANELQAATLNVANVTSQLSAASNMLDRNTLKAYIATQLGSPVTITFSLASSVTIDMVAIAHFKNVDGTVDITLKLATVTQDSATVSVQTYVEQSYLSAPFDSVVADEVVIEFDTPADSEEFEIGYVAAGPLSQSFNPESFRVSVVSADPFQTSRAGTPETSVTYLVERVEVTLPKLDFNTIRDLAIDVMGQGYGNPLFWYFDEPCILSEEIILAVWDSETFSMDAFYKANESALANATIGLLEVY